MDSRTFSFLPNLIGEDLLKMFMDIKDRGGMLGSLNSTFLIVIPKVDHPNNFWGFRPISLCNMP